MDKIELLKYDVFIFDWDGTLNPMRLVLRINGKLKRFMKLFDNLKEIKKIDTIDLNKLDKETIKHKEAKNNLLSIIIDMFLIFSKPKIHNDTIELLQILKKNNKKIVLFTNGGSYRVEKELRYLKLNKYFDLVISARKLRSLKPSSIGIELICKLLKSDKQRVLMLGDSIDDLISGRKAEINICGISDGFDSFKTLKAAKPDYLFRSIEQLKNNLE